MDEVNLRRLSYKELQSLAARFCVPGNIKKDIMIKVIIAAQRNDYYEVRNILNGIQHTRKKRFKHLKLMDENQLIVNPSHNQMYHNNFMQNTRPMSVPPIPWASSKLEVSSVKTPVHHYLIQHYQNTFLNTFPPTSPTPSILSLPPTLSPYPPPPLTPFPPPAPTPLTSLISLPPPRKEPSWPPPIMDLRVDQSQTDQSSPLDLQRKTVLLTSHSQHQSLPPECSVLKQLLQSSLTNSKEHDDSDTMTANTDSTDEASINNDNSYINSYENPPPYTSRTSFTPQLQFNPHLEPLNPQSDLPLYPHSSPNQLHSQPNPNLQLLPYPTPNLQLHPHPQPQLHPHSQSQLQFQTQLVSADLWDYQSIQSLSNQQLDTELEITSYESSNKINVINNYEQYNYSSIEQNEVQSEDKNTNYYQDINENKNGYSINYEHRYNNNYINNYNSNPNPNDNNGCNLNDSYDNESFDNNYVDNESINANGHDYINCHGFKTKDCLINNNQHGENDSNINEPLKDLINYSNTWTVCSNKSLTDKSLSATTSIGSCEETRDGINGGQLESILNIRDINDGNEVDEEKISQTSSVYCYSEPVTSPRLNYEAMGDKVRNFKLIAEKRRHLFGIKYKVYDDSSTGRAMSQFETRD